MAKRFEPTEYNYEITEDNPEVIQFQRVISKEDVSMRDIIELAFWKQPRIWVMFVDAQNLNQFLPQDTQIAESYKIPVFSGEIKSAFEYELITKRIVKDPRILIQLGS